MTFSESSKATAVGRRDDTSTCNKEAEFVRLLTPSYRSIYAYARTLLPNPADAEDCVQEASLLLWRKFDDFDRDGSFSHWAKGFVRRLVKNHHRRTRENVQSLDDDLIDRLMLIPAGAQELLELRRERLLECLSRLPVSERKLIRYYYEQEESITETARKLQRSPAAVYQAIHRTRLALFRCVDRQLKNVE
ncbi:sigma-70 family RNA polymerase sigma factor [Planctomicrobium sp. SH661]|uniref:sigma-70 family RNA polymerase sigma factor n=1 Tax=Planctomicrobium sp. SH661 TaxID=3448124 RepID=UPI003F5C8F7F